MEKITEESGFDSQQRYEIFLVSKLINSEVERATFSMGRTLFFWGVKRAVRDSDN
jgi:hypothetical protein